MKAYMFQAALLCEDCGDAVKAQTTPPEGVDTDNPDESLYDSDDYPKGPYPDGGGEADVPQHCDSCGVFLENPLTPDGDQYVRSAASLYETEPDMSWQEIAAAATERGNHTLAEWIEFYLQWG